MKYVIECAEMPGLYYGLQPYDGEEFWASNVKYAEKFDTADEARSVAKVRLGGFATKGFVIQPIEPGGS